MFLKKEIYLLLIWFIFFSLIVISMPHKEDRFIMPIIPVICLVSGVFISKIGKIKNIIFGILCIILIISIYSSYKIEYRNSKDLTIECYKEGSRFISNNINHRSIIISNQDPMTHYYTGMKILVYTNPWNLVDFRKNINDNYINNSVYMFFSNYDMAMDSIIKKDLDSNFNKVYECNKDYGHSVIYKYN